MNALHLSNLAKLPYNRFATTCDTETIVRQFLTSDSGSR